MKGPLESRRSFLLQASMVVAAQVTHGLTPQFSPSPALYGASGISPYAVRQGSLGSCFFHASVASIAKASSASIRSAIIPNRQSGYRVKFVTGPEELIYEEDLEYARHRGYDHSEGEWVSVLMRGYAQRQLRKSMIQAVQRSTALPAFTKPVALSALQETSPLLVAYDRAIRSVVSQDGKLDKSALSAQLTKEFSLLGIPPAQARVLEGLLEEAGFVEALTHTVQENGEVFGAYRSIGQGGIPFGVIEALMGKAVSVAVSNSALLAESLHNLGLGRIAIVAGTKESLAPAAPLQSGTIEATQGHSAPLKTLDWFVPGHAYSVLGYDEARASILLRNPWAGHPGSTGSFQLDRRIFDQAFAACTCSAAH